MQATAPDAGLELRFLGPLEARRSGETLPLGGTKQRAVLADLLVHLGEVVSVDRLIDAVWPERPPASAVHAIEVYVSQLRKRLDPERRGLLPGGPGGYAVKIDPEHVDARRFERLLDEGRRALADGEASRAAERLCEAIALWRGEALADFAYEPFAQEEIARLEELRVQALESRIDADLALGRHSELVGELEALVVAQPLRERTTGQLMLALYRSERQADALAAYRSARERMVEELGIEPGPQLRSLEASIIRQEQELLGPAPVRPVRVARRQRKLVTVLSADIFAGTGDPETLDGALRRALDLAAEVVAAHGGLVERSSGDALMAVFGAPVAHEDDALRAARAAVTLRDGLRELNDRLEVEVGFRLGVPIGLATGEAVVVDPVGREGSATGDAVNLAARLREAGAPGEIVVDDLTRRLVSHAARLEPLGELALRGREPVPAFRLLEVDDDAPAVVRRSDVPFTGRHHELGRLRQAFAEASRGPGLRAVLTLGPPGIGKSRLARELERTLGDRATILGGRCLPYGTGITFWPVLMAVRAAAGSAAGGALEALLGDGDGPTPSTDEIAWAFRGFCEELARDRPLLLVLDDLHWAEPALLDLVDYLVQQSAGAPILVLALAREDLLEERRDFLSGHERLELAALPAGDTQALVESLSEAAPLSEETLRLIAGTAEGNPLFLEQLVALAMEDGSIAAERPLPTTIQALLLARIDRTGPAERAVLERGAVVGTEFSRGAVTALLEPALAATVDRHLEALVRRGFVRPARQVEAYEEGFSFSHGLIQAAVYGATPKSDRAELHERYAGWLERRSPKPTGDADALLGYHLEQAFRQRAELGPVDARLRVLASDAGARLGRAGIRAWKRGDAAAATNLLGRATSLLPPDDPTRRELLCELGLALRTAGEPARADEALTEALASAADTRDRRIELRAEIELGTLRLLTSPGTAAEPLLESVERAIPVLESIGDDRALGRALLVDGFVQGAVRGRNAYWHWAAERARAHYERSGWPTSTCLEALAAALYYGPAPAPGALAQLAALSEEPSTDRAGRSHLLVFAGGLEAQRGHFKKARLALGQARATYEEFGRIPALAMNCGPVAASVALLAGDLDEAEHELRTACAQLEAIRDWSHLASQAADLASVLYDRGRYEEAAEWLGRTAGHAAPDDVIAQLGRLAVEAKLLARAGKTDRARRLAGQAVGLAESTDALNQHANALLDLAEVLRLADRRAEASASAREALRLYTLKRNTVAMRRTRELAEQLGEDHAERPG